MAVSTNLVVNITANGGQMTKSLADLQAQLGRFKKSLDNATDPNSIARLNRAIEATQGRMAALNTVAGSNGPAAKMTKDFTGLSRVIQDLPFGFVAISNNLTQLLPAAGGLGLAFSALVAGLTFASTGLANWTRGLTGSKDAVDANTASLAEFDLQLEQSAARVDKLRSSLEFINQLGKLRIDLALGKGLTTDLADLQAQNIGNRDLKKRIEAEQAELKKSISVVRERLLREIASDNTLFEAFDKGILGSYSDKLSEEGQKIFGTYQALEKQIENFADQIVDAGQKESILRAQIAGKKVEIEEEAAKKEEEARKKGIAAYKKYLDDLKARQKEELERLIRHEKAMREARDRAVKVPGLASITNEDLRRANETRIESDGQVSRTNITDPNERANINALIEGMDELIARSLLANQAVNSIGDAFAAMGQSFIEGGNGIKAFFSALKSSISQILGQLIKTAAIAGILSAITGGAGASFGNIFKSLLSGGKVPGFATGGLVFGPTLGLIGEGIGTSKANPEVIAPLSDLKKYIGQSGGQQVHVTGELIWSGDQLRAALAQADKKGGLFI